MKIFLKFTAITTILALIFAGCETTEKIDDFPLRPSRLVVNCFFSEDSAWNLQVSKSLSVLDNADLKLIGNANIKLYEDGIHILTIDSSDSDQWYRSNSGLPSSGKSYSIEVNAPGFGKTLKADNYLPPVGTLVNSELTINDSTFYDNYYYSYGYISGTVNFLIDDPPGKGNYYEIKLFRYDSVFTFINDVMVFSHMARFYIPVSIDDPVVYGDSYTDKILFSDNLFDGQKYKLGIDFDDWNARKNISYSLEVKTMTREAYLYNKTIEEYVRSYNDPFSEPVVIFSNIENGYGIFAGITSRDFVVVNRE